MTPESRIWKGYVGDSLFLLKISGTSAGKTWRPEVTWRLGAGIIWSCSFKCLDVMLADGWDLSWGCQQQHLQVDSPWSLSTSSDPRWLDSKRWHPKRTKQELSPLTLHPFHLSHRPTQWASVGGMSASHLRRARAMEYLAATLLKN